MSGAPARLDCPRGNRDARACSPRRPCSTCQKLEAVDQAVDLLAAMRPGIDLDLVRESTEAAATSAKPRRSLLAWLSTHPDGLDSGSSDSPPVAARLLAELSGRGVAVAQPICVDCKRMRPLRKPVPGGRICERCTKLRRREVCARCGVVKTVETREPDGRAVCHNCRTADQTTWRTCGRCGQLAHRVRVEDGVNVGTCCYVRPLARCSVCGVGKGGGEGRSRRPVCVACSGLPRAPCATCGLDAPAPVEGEDAVCARCRKNPPSPCSGCGALTIGRNKEDQPRCHDCYREPVRPCGRCGRVRTIMRRARDGEPDLCAACWKGPVMACEGCGHIASCQGQRKGRMLCRRCRPVKVEECAHCGRMRVPNVRWKEGPVCQPCYARALRRKATCPGCGQLRRLGQYDGFPE